MSIRVVSKLSAEPFILWLEKRVEDYGGVKAFADDIGADYVWLARLLNRRFQTVSLDKADRVLCSDGTCHIRELYPELYEE